MVNKFSFKDYCAKIVTNTQISKHLIKFSGQPHQKYVII